MENQSEKGITILEVLMVLTILSLSLIIIGPNLKSPLRNASYEGKVEKLVFDISNTRNQSIRKNTETVFYFDSKDKQYWSSIQTTKTKLSNEIDIDLIAADSEYLNFETAGIRFYPDGSSTGGSITFRKDNKTHIISVDWLTGHVDTKVDQYAG